MARKTKKDSESLPEAQKDATPETEEVVGTLDAAPEHVEQEPEAIPEPKPSGPNAIKIFAKGASFWRCGRNFGKTPTIIPLAQLKPGELERFRAEKQLISELVTV